MDKACKSRGRKAPADEVVTRRNVPGSRAQLVERRGNSRYCREMKDLSLPERPALYQLVGRVTAYQGYDA